MFLLNELEVVDVTLALNMMGGNEMIYRKVVESFLVNQSHVIPEVESNLDKDLKEARRLVHSIKGIAQNIGSMKLYQVAMDFELVLIQNIEAMNKGETVPHNEAILQFHLKEFKTVLNQVINELKTIQFTA